MSYEDVAKRLVEVASKKGGNIFVGDISEDDKKVALEHSWIEPVGIGHFQLTDAGRVAAE